MVLVHNWHINLLGLKDKILYTNSQICTINITFSQFEVRKNRKTVQKDKSAAHKDSSSALIRRLNYGGGKTTKTFYDLYLNL